MVSELWGVFKPLVDMNVAQNGLDIVEMYNIFKKKYKEDYKINEPLKMNIYDITVQVSAEDSYKYFALSMMQTTLPPMIVKAIGTVLFTKLYGGTYEEQLAQYSGELKEDLKYISKDLGKVRRI